MCAVMLFVICACKPKQPTDTTTDGTSGSDTSGTTASVLSTQQIQTEAIRIPVEEIANAIKIDAQPITETKEIPLIIILANFDADGDGENDWDENDTDKLYSDKTKPYYGEQWAGSELTDHYDLYFGETGSLSAYYEELTMGAFKFVPIEFDVMPEGSPVPNGMIEITVSIPHPSASGDASGTIAKVFNATDPYIDYTKYDLNDNGTIDATELGVIILNPGQDKSNGTTSLGGRHYFQVHGTSQSLGGYCDGLSFSKVSNFGEYGRNSAIMQIGTPAHELAHNLGAEDLYDTNRNGHGGATVSGWPRAYDFSLESNGNHRGNGMYPTYLDPYHRIYLGWAEEHVVGDGVYTISSTLTGNYTVLRVNTPDPDEYYLVEIRLKEGFEKKLTDGDSLGGIMVWHIDEALNRRYFVEGSASTSTMLSGKRHDPAIVPLFRIGFDAEGRYMADTTPDDPFYYYSESDPTTAVFESGKFRSVTNGTQSFNSYPSNWEGKENYNLRIEVLSAPGQEMTVKISGSQDGRKDFAPVVKATYNAMTHNSITVAGKITALNGATITDCAIAFSTSEDFSENLITKAATYDAEKAEFTAVFDGLNPETRYYYKVYLLSDNGYSEATSDAKTLAAPKEKTNMKISLYSDVNATAYTITVDYGKALSIPAGWIKNITGKKPGQKLEGWYLDKEFTQPYDINTIVAKGTEDFSIYAKWVPAE